MLTVLYQKFKGVLSGFLQGSELDLVSQSVFISNPHKWAEDMLKSAKQELMMQVCQIIGLELKILLLN